MTWYHLWIPPRSLFFSHSKRLVVMDLHFPKCGSLYSHYTGFLEPQSHSWDFAFAISSAWKTLHLILLMCLINENSAGLSSSLVPRSTFPRLLKVSLSLSLPLHQSLSDHPLPFLLPRSEVILFTCICISLFYDPLHQNVKTHERSRVICCLVLCCISCF